MSQLPSEPQMLYGNIDLNSPPEAHLDSGHDVMPTEIYNVAPREAHTKDFSLIKNGLKYFRVGIDINNFTPFVSLVAKTTNKVVQITGSEFQDLVSEDFYNSVVKNYEKKVAKPLSTGNVQVSVKKYATSNTICVEKENAKIYMALSSWKFIQRIKKMMLMYLAECETLCFQANSGFSDLLTHIKNFCLPHSKDFAQINEAGMYNMLCNAFEGSTIYFPGQLMQEILCYHLDYLRQCIADMLKEN